MINKNILRVLLLLLFLYSNLSLGGSPGGLILYVHPLSSGLKYKKEVDAYFYKHYGVDNENAPSCSENYANRNDVYRPAVDVFYLKRRVDEINEALIENALKNKKERRKLRGILYNFRGEKVNFGFDGILIYGETDGIISFYGVSSFSKKNIVVESSLSANDIADETKLGLALCGIFSRLPVPET